MNIRKHLSKFKNKLKPSYGWFGDFASWQQALGYSKGYDSREIIEKVKQSALKVKNGKATFERDSVAFYIKEYNWPILCHLLKISIDNKLKLRVIDFGGSLGSLYYQHRDYFSNLEELKWGVVEQRDFVEIGKTLFEDNQLQFFFTIKEAHKEIDPSVVILSSVLPYLEQPYSILQEILELKPQFLIFDKMPFIQGQDRITIQKIPPNIYMGSYPAWFFNYTKFEKTLGEFYTLVGVNDCAIPCNIKASFKGLFYKRKNEGY